MPSALTPSSPKPAVLKPPALKSGDAVRLVSLASPIKEELLRAGCDELRALGLQVLADEGALLARSSYFAGSAVNRLVGLRQALAEPESRGVICTRGGYGSAYLLEMLSASVPPKPKIFVGASDISSLQIFLWQKFGWVTFYGPMVATNFSRGPGMPHGYDRESFLRAVNETATGWMIDLQGESLAEGSASGVLLGGCLTLIETALATPWELQTEGAILVIEDRGMKPYAIDRSLIHLRQAGKLRGLAGVILGEFPDCEAAPGDETARDVAQRILGPLGIPIVWGAPVGHTSRPMLTLPLGVQARLVASKTATRLEILEPACSA